MEIASREVINACGLNVALFGMGNAAAVREAWRLALFGVLSPLGKLVEAELNAKLEDSVTISWQELRASDLIVVGHALCNRWSALAWTYRRP